MPFGTKKTRMVWLPDGEKIQDIFIRFDRMHEPDGHTQTPHDDIDRALHSIAWQKSLFSTNISLHLRNDTRYGRTECE